MVALLGRNGSHRLVERVAPSQIMGGGVIPQECTVVAPAGVEQNNKE